MIVSQKSLLPVVLLAQMWWKPQLSLLMFYENEYKLATAMSANEYEPRGAGSHLVHLLRALLSASLNELDRCCAPLLPSAILSQTSDWQGPGSRAKPAFTLSLWPIGLILPLSCYRRGERCSVISAVLDFHNKSGAEAREQEGNDRHFSKSYSHSYV